MTELNKQQKITLKEKLKELEILIKTIGDGTYKFKVKKGKIIDLSYEKKLSLDEK